jgi:hypothetical protein
MCKKYSIIYKYISINKYQVKSVRFYPPIYLNFEENIKMYQIIIEISVIIILYC